MHILIPTHGRPKRLGLLLDSIVTATKPSSLVAIHVIENGSQLAQQLVESYQDRLPIQYSYLEEGNKSKALNAVAAKLPVEALLVFFDDDIKIDPEVLVRYQIETSKLGPGHYYGGGHRADYETQPNPKIVQYFPTSNRPRELAGQQDVKVFPAFQDFLGFNWACFNQDLQAIGGFSPDFGPGSKSGARGQETDAQYRLHANGVKAVAIGRAKVDHFVPSKFVSEDWLVERIFLSSIHLGREKASFIKSIGLLIKLQFSFLQKALGNTSIGPRYRIAKAAGYFKGLVQ